MSSSERERLFNTWAKDYDASVRSCDNSFPFDGYDQILDEVVRLTAANPSMRILDLGIGTGNLAARFVDMGCPTWSVDFSAEMLASTHSKLPEVHLVQTDLLGEWSTAIQPPFDRVVSAYVLHEFDLEMKVKLLQRIVSRYLSPDGRILIADIAFPTTAARKTASERWADDWDHSECYWAADEAIAACERAGLLATYRQISSCGGVFTFKAMDAE